MSSLMKITLALMAAAFIGSSPAMAADTTPPQAPAVTQQRPDIGDALKEKASRMVDEAKQKADSTADKLQKSLGSKKDQVKDQVVNVQEESVTVETPKGISQETITTITPEKAATDATTAPAGK